MVELKPSSKFSRDLLKKINIAPLTPIVIKFKPYIELHEGLKDIEGLRVVVERAVELPNNIKMIGLLANLNIAKKISKLASVEKLMHNYTVSALWDFPVMNQLNQQKVGIFAPPSELVLDTSEIRELMGVNVAQSQGFTGKGIKVGVIDTGFWASPRIYMGDRPEYHRIDANKDNNGHGSHVGGIIKSPPYEFNNEIKVHGMAPDCNLYISKALRTVLGTGASLEIAEAISSCQRAGCHLINMSLGGAVDYQTYNWEDDPIALALESVYNEGVLSIVAVGNEGPEPKSAGSPAISPHAVSCGSFTNKYQSVAYFSSRGPSPDGRKLPHLYGLGGGGPSADDFQETIASTVMPGSLLDVISDQLPNSIANVMGSSQSTPGVCGLLADIWQDIKENANRDMNYTDVMKLSSKASTILKWETWEQYRNSVINPM